MIFGPRLWVNQILKEHNRREVEGFPSGGDLARELLARHRLDDIKVEGSDIGDHYDPKAKAVRLTRDKIERKTLTAITAAAHEVAHALQDASHYGPFVWRMRLVTLAQTTGQIGTVVLIAVPAVSILTHQTLPPLLIGSVISAMLGTGMAAQLLALPTELDASFGRAMPLLKDGYITERQARDSRKILVASSMTYVASSLLSVLNVWPWLGWWRPIPITVPRPRPLVRLVEGGNNNGEWTTPHIWSDQTRCTRRKFRQKTGLLEDLTRQIGKPLIRGWFLLCRTG